MFVRKFHFFVIQDKKTTKLKHEVQSNLQVCLDDVMYRRVRNVCFICYLSDRTMCVGQSYWLCTNRFIFSALCVDRGRPLLARHSTQPNLSIFSSKWFYTKRPFLVRKFFKKLMHSVLFFFLGTLIKCLSSMENSIVFVIINNNLMSLNHNKVRTSQMWLLNLIIELAAVSVSHVQKNCKNQNNLTKVWQESYWPLFCGHSVVIGPCTRDDDYLSWAV